MKILQTGYAYLFFFFYNSVNKVKGNIFVVGKALILVAVMDIMVIASAFIYAVDIFRFLLPTSTLQRGILPLAIVIIGFHLWFFERNGNWKRYIAEFEAWPENKRKKWDRAMRFIVFFIIANLVLSFYWMSEIDWHPATW